MELVRHFSGLTKTDSPIAGGKGASLGEMTTAGIPVPPGFVVLSGAFEQFIKETDLTQEIDAVLHTVNHKDIATVERASEKIRALILDQEMPEDIKKEIDSQFKKLGTKYVAVRSSATAEDGKDHAWAGQLESYLNTTEDDVLTKVKLCWSSLFTPRAIFYRFEKELHLTKISVAVVVQKMVESEVSGIAFSVHPVTEDYNQLIIEAGFGLGEAIVSGQVTPDSYVVEKEPRRILDINVSTQERALYRAEKSSVEHGNNEWRTISEPKASSQVLTEAQILELSEIIMKIENHYGFPCDIEWAWEAGKFYIVQSRPITTLAPKVVVHKIDFEKAYTRDTTMIIQQGWYECVANPLYGNGSNPHVPPVIHHMNDGVIEIWENKKATVWIMDSMQQFIREHEEKLLALVATYEKDLAEIQKYWKKGFISDPDEFATYVNEVFRVMKGFDCMYYASIDERTPAHVRAKVQKIRDADSYFDSNDKVMRASLIAMHPHLKGYESAILKSEIKNPPSIEILKNRKKNFIVLGEGYAESKTLEEYAKDHADYHFEIETPPNSQIISGQVGNKGYAKGRVRIMKRKEQIGEAQEGDIIVSTMTTPDFVPAMQKAAAIVTDEGGIMCHAAIVARELGKPCVIGTKFGTQILKDGDMVEVDADKGVVRILEKASPTFIDGKNWFLTVTRNMSFWHECLLLKGFYNNSVDFGIDHKLELLSVTTNGTETSAFLYQPHFGEYVTKLNLLMSTPHGVDEIIKRYKKFTSSLIASLEKLEKEVTIETLSDFFVEYSRYTAGLMVTTAYGRSGNDLLINRLKELNFTDEEIPAIVSKVTYPADHTPLFNSQLDLLKIGEKIQIGKEVDLDRELVAWVNSFGNIPVNYCEEPWTIANAKQQLDLLLAKDCVKELETLKKSHDDRIASAKEILVKIGDEKVSNLAYSLAQATFINEFRKNIFSTVSLRYRPAFKMLAEKAGSSNWRDCFYLTPQEMISILKGERIDLGAIKKDRAAVAMLINAKGEIDFLDAQTTEGLNQYIMDQYGLKKSEKVEVASEVRGFSANHGKVKGIVKVILSSKDFAKLNPGEILVTTMTSVDFVPVMERAGAFVTNEGGITSHASIVAREMNKPCVIGTKNATQILKDGDMVEVDADKGEVRILT